MAKKILPVGPALTSSKQPISLGIWSQSMVRQCECHSLDPCLCCFLLYNSISTYVGFSDDVGIVYYGGETGQEHASAKTRSQIDEEVKKLTGASYDRAKVSVLCKKFR